MSDLSLEYLGAPAVGLDELLQGEGAVIILVYRLVTNCVCIINIASIITITMAI